MWKVILTSICVLFFFSVSAQAELFNGWKIIESKEGDFSLKKDTLTFALDKGNVVAKIEKVKKFKNLSIIIYHQGTNGTSLILETYNAVVFDRDSNKFLGEFPYKHLPISKYEKGTLPKWPKWSYLKDRLRIVDGELEIDESFLTK